MRGFRPARTADEKKARFQADYGLSAYDAGVLVAEKEAGDFFETVAKAVIEACRELGYG